MQLFEQARAICQQIGAEDRAEYERRLAENMRSAARSSFQHAAQTVRKATIDGVPGKFATVDDEILIKAWVEFQLRALADLAPLVQAMVEAIQSPNVEPRSKLLLVGVLVYLVAPNDAIRDSTPGGCGYLDDAFIIYAMALELLPLLRLERISLEELRTRRLALFAGIPESAMVHVCRRLDDAFRSFRALEAAPAIMVDAILDRVLGDPAAMESLVNQCAPQSAAQSPVRQDPLQYLSTSVVQGSDFCQVTSPWFPTVVSTNGNIVVM